jgi:glutamyl-tRNA synthetase
MIEDLRWFGLEWQEGPDQPHKMASGHYNQSERFELYRTALEALRAGGFIYPCTCSRKDIRESASAPNIEGEEPIYPGTCRQNPQSPIANRQFSWRFRVPDGELISFTDRNLGPQSFVAEQDFGDFVVWSCRGAEEVPAYQLACVVDDVAMRITEVVRGADLLVSTARQLLLYRALGWTPPAFYHCELMKDAAGVRLAKRHEALSLRALRRQGKTPAELRQNWGE